MKKVQKQSAIKNLADKFKKVGLAILQNSKVSAEAGYSVAKASFETDIGKAIDRHKSEGSFFKNQDRVYFYKHISDRVKDELEKIRATENFRIVIFIDDLDRCTPERALDILESIKTFFDIEGIIFVIGIDPSTIDPIIKTKYGDDSKINGMKYLQKIVQLPYPIPLWNPPRLSDTITRMIKETRLPENVIDTVLKPKMQELIIKATELNPRDVKRFINSIVISQEIYGQKIDDIEKIIVIQAFYFHGDKWLEFLKLLIPYKQRIEFGMHFFLWLKQESTTISNLYDLNKSLQDLLSLNKSQRKDIVRGEGKTGLEYLYESLTNKSLLDIYKKLIDIGDDDLFAFLRVSIETLLKIDKIERYLRVLDPIGTIGKADLEIDIHKRNLDLSGGKLHGAKLSKADLYAADLSEADLAGADLSNADLYGADLSKAYLFDANLVHANLSKANLSKAYLVHANLSEADLSEADLSKADLSEADLSEANLSEADLSKANLSKADLVDANLSNAD